MRIGIIGSGRIGATVGRLWAGAGHEPMFSFSRDPARLEAAARSAGASARTGTPAEAAAFADVVLLAPPWAAIDRALAASGSLDGRVVIDTTNPFLPGAVGLALAQDGASAAEQIAARAPAARVVKAYNTLPAAILAAGRGATGGPPLALFLCGDDDDAKLIARALIADSGFVPVDTGPLARAREQEPGGPLFNQPLTEPEARELLAVSIAA